MPTLTETISETKTAFKWIGIGIIGIIVIFILFAIKNAFFPAAPPPPQVSFGKLPALDFPTYNKALSYNLDTISGNLPTFPQQLKVYEMQQAQPDLLALSKSQNIVGNIGFNDSPAKISDNIYQWRDNANRVLTMNIQTQNFNMFSDFLSDPNQPTFGDTIDKAVNVSQNFLTSMGIASQDIDMTQAQTGLFSIKNYSIVPASSLSTAQAVQVSFIQKPFNNLPIFYSQGQSPINFLVGEVNGEPQVVEANFFYQAPSDISSTYPVKTALEALDDLKKGEAFIMTSDPNAKISITKIMLAYYASQSEQNFFVPIIVFQGDGFLAYENAVKDEWVNK